MLVAALLNQVILQLRWEFQFIFEEMLRGKPLNRFNVLSERFCQVLKILLFAFSQERDSAETAVDVEAARLVAQKLGENGIGGDCRRICGISGSK